MQVNEVVTASQRICTADQPVRLLTGRVHSVAWAPVSALLLKTILGSNVIAVLDFVKEALPFTDLIPLATLGL